MKVVINTCFGGFGLSDAGLDLYKEKSGLDIDHPYDIERNDPLLVQVVEELGEMANGSYAKLKVVEIPDDIEWTIEDYDGDEWVAEAHRRWS